MPLRTSSGTTESVARAQAGHVHEDVAGQLPSAPVFPTGSEILESSPKGKPGI